jgi:hypothetical protein
MQRLMAIRDALPAMAKANASGPQIRNSEAIG